MTADGSPESECRERAEPLNGLERLCITMRGSKTRSAEAHAAVRSIVLSYNELAREAGQEVLDAGGNAFDAFIAATMVEYVVAEGGTSLAGPLGALVFDAATGRTHYLDGAWNTPLDPRGEWTPENPEPGRGVLIGGAPAALEALSKRFGRVPFSGLLEPAIYVASNGFEVSEQYAWCVRWRKKFLLRSEDGRQTFFPNGKALKAGAVLKQPSVADLLRGLAEHGANYMYHGPWAAEFEQTVQANGGFASRTDLASYRARWLKPLRTTYRQHRLFASSGTSYGGLWGLVALNVVGLLGLPRDKPYTESPRHLELLIRLSRFLWDESWLQDPKFLEQPGKVAERLSLAYATALAEHVAQLGAAPETANKHGTHSYHVIVVDAAGNAITGTNTINSNPWGQGIFVQGVPLGESGMFLHSAEAKPDPGCRAPLPFSMHMGFHHGRLRFVSGSFSDSAPEASLQFLINLLEYGLDAEQAATLPRFGTAVTNLNTLGVDPNRNWIDVRIRRRIRKELKSLGVRTHADPIGDTGLGGVARVAEDGQVEGALSARPPFGLTVKQLWQFVAASTDRLRDYILDLFRGRAPDDPTA